MQACDPDPQLFDTTLGGERRSIWVYRALFAALMLLLCLPVWCVEYLPLMDYPNHLARTYIIFHHSDVPVYRHAYTILLEPIPNVAMDALIPPMLYFIDVVTAGKVFTSLTILLFGFACHLLGKAVNGRPTWLALLCGYTSYNFMFLMGFLNYVFGLAMFLVTLSAWLRHYQRWTPGALAGVTALVFLSYLAHLSAYSFLGFTFVTICLLECFKARRISLNAVLSLITLVPPVIAFATFMRGSGKVGAVEWSTPLQKAKDLAATLRTYDHSFDAAIALSLGAAMLWLWLRARERRIDWRLYSVALLLVLLFLVCPKTLFTSWAADIRFLPPAMLLLVIGTRIRATRATGRAALCIAALALLVRFGNIWQNWHQLDSRIATQVALLENLPDGARVFPIVFDEDRERSDKLWQRASRHAIHYATIYQHTFSPSLFALRGQQPVIFKSPPPLRGIEDGRPLWNVNWQQVFDSYDYVWCCYLNESYERFLDQHCSVVARSGRLKILRVNSRKPLPLMAEQ